MSKSYIIAFHTSTMTVTGKSLKPLYKQLLTQRNHQSCHIKNKWKNKSKSLVYARVYIGGVWRYVETKIYGKNWEHNKQVIRHDIDDQVDDDGDDVRIFLVVVILGLYTIFFVPHVKQKAISFWYKRWRNLYHTQNIYWSFIIWILLWLSDDREYKSRLDCKR